MMFLTLILLLTVVVSSCGVGTGSVQQGLEASKAESPSVGITDIEPGGHESATVAAVSASPTPTITAINTPTDAPTYKPADTPTSTPTGTPTRRPVSTPTYTPTRTPMSTPTTVGIPAASCPTLEIKAPSEAPAQLPFGIEWDVTPASIPSGYVYTPEFSRDQTSWQRAFMMRQWEEGGRQRAEVPGPGAEGVFYWRVCLVAEDGMGPARCCSEPHSINHTRPDRDGRDEGG
jgi:hypothetical protein